MGPGSFVSLCMRLHKIYLKLEAKFRACLNSYKKRGLMPVPKNRDVTKRDIDDIEFLVGLGFWALSMQLDQQAAAIEALTAKVDRLAQQEVNEMADLSALAAEVSENTDAVNSASALLSSLSQQLRDAANDPAAVQALADQLDQNNSALSDAVAANTPAAPEA